MRRKIMGDSKKIVLSLPCYVILISILFFSLTVITGCTSGNSTSPATGAGTGTGTGTTSGTGTETGTGTGTGTGTETGTETGAGTETETPLSTVPTPPLIGDLTYTPSEIIQQGGGGAYSVAGSVSFLDRNGDVTQLTIEVFDNAGALVKTIEQDTSVSGTASGIIDFTFYIDSAATTANYSFEVYATDSADHISNVLTGDGNETGNLNSNPVIGNLGFDPISSTGILVGVGGGWSSVKGSIDFLDIEAKVSTLIINVYKTDTLHSFKTLKYTINQSAGVLGETSGTINFEVFVDNVCDDNTDPNDPTVLYTFETYLIDSSGLESNIVTHDLNVQVVHPYIDQDTLICSMKKGTVADHILPITVKGSVMSWDDDVDIKSISIKAIDNTTGETLFTDSADAGVFETSDMSKISFNFNVEVSDAPKNIYFEFFVVDRLALQSVSVFSEVMAVP
jgi:hypothetical protein